MANYALSESLIHSLWMIVAWEGFVEKGLSALLARCSRWMLIQSSINTSSSVHWYTFPLCLQIPTNLPRLTLQRLHLGMRRWSWPYTQPERAMMRKRSTKKSFFIMETDCWCDRYSVQSYSSYLTSLERNITNNFPTIHIRQNTWYAKIVQYSATRLTKHCVSTRKPADNKVRWQILVPDVQYGLF